MSPPVAALLSYRLGGSDGVSVEAAKWEWALGSLGFRTRRIAGEFGDTVRADDILLRFLAIDPGRGAVVESDALAESLAGTDLVVVENLCSLPLNLEAARVAVRVLGDFPGRVLFHHHDLPWERAELSHLTEFPPNRPRSLHVVISEHARRSLRQHGLDGTVIRNAFDTAAPAGDRPGTRSRLGFGPRDLVVLQPTRAIPRKEVRTGLQAAEALVAFMPEYTVRYWLTGPAEDGYGPALADVVASAQVGVTEGRVSSVGDAYAAADLVVLPSSWEGFGNPVVEAVLAERPVAVAHYPVLDELLAFGLELLPIDDASHVAAFLRDPDNALLRRNRDIVARELSLERLPSRLLEACAGVGWVHW